jgi:hypothetical protein
MMDFGWENQTERLKRHMSISPKRKLELLYELNRFTRKYAFRNLLKKSAAGARAKRGNNKKLRPR